jgi:hypothetical protein
MDFQLFDFLVFFIPVCWALLSLVNLWDVARTICETWSWSGFWQAATKSSVSGDTEHSQIHGENLSLAVLAVFLFVLSGPIGVIFGEKYS